ncbi:trehalase family glycosidase [Coraliomargarita sp. SDUM461004]|uniref:Trehalase family glycosidase n=1 Tax=Thalassobacterium sedimentorum TaxID=3041258 RepID=A0ABU1AFU5_9BACT|nr:trehalase family glycosidase [Coraliomargarita sp. SDUM461004]MDQ8193697.1 trehalase family glycosidase [Coraliomargarita sp. SDUM461004]
MIALTAFAGGRYVGGPAGALESVYYIWDVGSGRWVLGPRGQGDVRAPIDIALDVDTSVMAKWRAIGLSGKQHAEGATKPVVALDSRTGQPLSGGAVDWSGVGASYVGAVNELLFDGLVSVDWLVLKGQSGQPFPKHLRVLTTVGERGPWYSVPSAVFSFLPDPQGNELWIPLNHLIASGIKIVVPEEQGEVAWSIGTAQIYGETKMAWSIEGEDPRMSATWWNMWLTFGVAKNQVHQRFDTWWETNRPVDGGMVCIGSNEWLYWGAKKLSWLGENAEARRLEDFIAGNPVDDDGLVWAAPNSPKHLGHSVHYVNNAIYPMAVAHHYLMQRDLRFLNKQDPKTGESILSKARRAMQYSLLQLKGGEGLVVFEDRETDGAPGSHGSNYWDFWLFGHQSAYANALFYESLEKFAELEASLGEEEAAQRYRTLRMQVKERFNSTFWNEKTGRYVGWIDVNGKVHDYGFTFVNQMVLALGLADEYKARRVLAWLDGHRRVEGDDSKGADIYVFGFAARANTIDAQWAKDAINTWNGALSVDPGGNAAFGGQVQNGGAIFYTSYYDLHARKYYATPQNVAQRWRGIVREFYLDQLNRDPANNMGNSDIFGIVREFPESGLVPYYFIDGILGMTPVADGLLFEPELMPEQDHVSVDRLYFNGQKYSVSVRRDITVPSLQAGQIMLPAMGRWLLSLNGKVMEEKI